MNITCLCIQLSKSESGGADRDRTDDIQLAKLALSQLSYSPEGARPPARVPAVEWA
jgi:hypothetical protein